MEQRRLRLGDIVDDYCPRERRVTNHAVVAMIEEDVKQTRCTTCDAEHVYKGGKAPRRRKPETTGALYKEVLAGITDADPGPSARAANDADADAGPETERGELVTESMIDASAESEASDPDIEDDEPQPVMDEGPVHRPLIRAQLPRIEGLKVERQAPEFTIRQNTGRGGFRGRSQSGNGGAGGGGGHRFGRGPNRDGGGGRGPNQGFGRGPGGGGQQRHGGGPRKRSR